MVAIKVNDLSVGYARKMIIEQLNLEFKAGKITAIIGPNGCGKSTLLKALSGIHPRVSGEITICNQELYTLSRIKLAKMVTILLQQQEIPDELSVTDLVSLGRYSHHGWRGLSKQDYYKIHEAICQVDLENFAHQSLAMLSGGQRQRAWIAMALAQDSEIILLDEPTTYLDIRYQLEILSLLNKLNHVLGKTIIMVIHDIQQALQFCDHLVLMNFGQVVFNSEVAQITDMQIFEKVFGVKMKLYTSEFNHRNVSINQILPTNNRGIYV